MAISNNYFEQKFKNISYHKTMSGNLLAINIDVSDLGRNLDKAQYALDTQVWTDIQKYMPIDTGALIAQTNILNMSTRGEVYFMPPNHDYAHYLWEGKKYVDPLYKIGAFYSEEYGFWSRKGVEKIPTEIPLDLSRGGHPLAQRHWDEVAFTNHHSEWVDLVRRMV